ncbi:hypothetical protein MVEG_07001 [Podila verticillata NRRL 6337]|nr:hypothetical protein MVEG_07001 [Podila verticillata NRRL 6337]
MAPFSLAWTIQRNEHCSEKANKDGNLLTGQAVDKDQKLLTKLTKPAIPATPTTVAGGGALVLRMIWHFVFPFDKFFIHSHYDDLQAYDNPAFFGLDDLQMDEICLIFFCLRLLFQISYEVLVLVVTLFQLYGDEEQRSDLVGGYITIIVLGHMLLHLEFQQMRGGISRYFSSPYNYVDLCAYVIPIASNCILITNSDQIVALRALSFSVVLIYIHLTGYYGPVQTSLTNGLWTIRLMVSVFFFLTAVLMMNVVIALMNGIYTGTVLIVDQIWLKNRLDLIAGAENLSFFLPCFRDHFDYFPKWVYYAATDKEVEEYRMKYGLYEIKSRFAKDDGEDEEEVEEEVEEDSERDDDEDDDDDEEEKVEEKKFSSDIAVTATSAAQDATDTTLPSSSQETQNLVKEIKVESSEIKDRITVQDDLWAEWKKQQEQLEFQELEIKARERCRINDIRRWKRC